MPYRRPPQNSKRFLPPLFPLYGNSKRVGTAPATGVNAHREYLDIPLPNEREYPYELAEERKKFPGLSSIFDFIKEHIKVEELILIGLIILLLDEAMEDQLLLIILVYILLF